MNSVLQNSAMRDPGFAADLIFPDSKLSETSGVHPNESYKDVSIDSKWSETVLDSVSKIINSDFKEYFNLHGSASFKSESICPEKSSQRALWSLPPIDYDDREGTLEARSARFQHLTEFYVLQIYRQFDRLLTYDVRNLPTFSLPSSDVFEQPHFTGLIRRYWCEYDPEVSERERSLLASSIYAHVFGEGFSDNQVPIDTSNFTILIQPQSDNERCLNVLLLYSRTALRTNADSRDIDVPYQVDINYRIVHFLAFHLKLLAIGREIEHLSIESRQEDFCLRRLLAKKYTKRLFSLRQRAEKISASIENLTLTSIELDSLTGPSYEVARDASRVVLRGGLFESISESMVKSMIELDPRISNALTKGLYASKFNYSILARAKAQWERLDTEIEIYQAEQSTKLALIMSIVGLLQLIPVAQFLLSRPIGVFSYYDVQSWPIDLKASVVTLVAVAVGAISWLWITRRGFRLQNERRFP